MVTIQADDIVHYGILRRSGRYPWGSGGHAAEATRHTDFLNWLKDLKKRLGWSDAQVAESVGISTKQLRELNTIAKHQQKAEQIAMAQRLKDKAYSNVAIGQRMGIPESSVRNLLDPGTADRNNVLAVTAKALREQVEKHKYVDIGLGTENYLGVSKEKKDAAVALLRDEGYEVHYVKVPQVSGKGDTTQKVIAPPGTTYSEIYRNRDQIQNVTGTFTDDGGRTRYGLVDPLSVSPDRITIRYKEDGGALEDGVIYVRPGVEDVSLGDSRYAQVRVKIGDDHYMKGMAIYRDDLPDGVDLVFNTNKSDTGNKLDALKKLERNADGDIDPDNPFGSYIRKQIVKDLPDGTKAAKSAMNLVNEEGNWETWSNTISSQVLSKQSPDLAKTQLRARYDQRKQEFDEIMALTNPTIKRRLLQQFADAADSSAVHLEAASLPRQKYQVILPVPNLPDNQVYAPSFRNGERVALIRYPHGGTFEIPDLVVNNRHAESIRILGKEPRDAIGINAKVAERLSGADFDGDTVLVIPNNSGRIQISSALRQLKNFDPKGEYAAYPGMPKLSEVRKQKLMGDVSNLITDMTIKGAPHDEIARAVKHSMVVIDAAKHNLDYKRSAIDNGISALKEKYQGGPTKGAATLVSRAGSDIRVPERTLRRASKGGPIDPVTGRRVYEETGNTYVDRNGRVQPKLSKVKKLDYTDDANTLSSGTPMERIYAEHSNKLKNLANQARLAMLNTPRAKYSPSAAKTYAKEVASIESKLDLAYRNKPLERQAQVYANAISRLKMQANPNLKDDVATRKKIEYQALTEARNRTGAGANRIKLTREEWDAIQAGAISDTKLRSILDYADMDVVRELATPRTQLLMSPSLTSRARQMAKQGATRAEIAQQLGVSKSTLDRALDG